MKSKMRFACVVIAVEVGLGMSWYFFSVGGRQARYARLAECTTAEKQLDNERKALDALETELDEWEHDTFFVERDAREKLALSRPDEEIVVV